MFTPNQVTVISRAVKYVVCHFLIILACSCYLQHRGFGRLSYLSNDDSREDSNAGRKAFTKVASYKGTLVSVKMLKKRHVEITRAVKMELYMMKEMTADNINRFMGACIDPPNICIVTSYCARGSLKDILENDDLHLDDMFIASLVKDLIAVRVTHLLTLW